MEFIFASHLGEKRGAPAEEVAAIKAHSARLAAECNEEMKDADGDNPPPLEPSRSSSNNNKRALDLGMIEAHVPPSKKYKEPKIVRGKVLQCYWTAEDCRDAKLWVLQHTISHQQEEGRSEKSKIWGCDEWKLGKQGYGYVNFREIPYQFQTLAFFALRPGAVLQQSMTVSAYPCENLLCVTPAHLFLSFKRKRGPKNRHLPPMDSRGMELVQQSQQAVHQIRNKVDDKDMEWAAPVSLRDFLRMDRADRTQLTFSS